MSKHNTKRTKCSIWTRGMGYYRPTWAFNVGKLSEFKERVFFSLSGKNKTK